MEFRSIKKQVFYSNTELFDARARYQRESITLIFVEEVKLIHGYVALTQKHQQKNKTQKSRYNTQKKKQHK